MAMLILQISVVLLLILCNGFFAMAEIALVSSRKARLQSLAEAGSANARAALALKAEPTHLLSTVQIGITVIAVLSGTWPPGRGLSPDTRIRSAWRSSSPASPMSH
jgi:putative hemolysin